MRGRMSTLLSEKAGRGVTVEDQTARQADVRDRVYKIGQRHQVCVLVRRRRDDDDSLRRLGLLVIGMKLEAAFRVPAGSTALRGDLVRRRT